MTTIKENLTKDFSVTEKSNENNDNNIANQKTNETENTGFAMLSGYLSIAKTCKDLTSEKEETKE